MKLQDVITMYNDLFNLTFNLKEIATNEECAKVFRDLFVEFKSSPYIVIDDEELSKIKHTLRE